jgi:hypothetical protein
MMHREIPFLLASKNGFSKSSNNFANLSSIIKRNRTPRVTTMKHLATLSLLLSSASAFYVSAPPVSVLKTALHYYPKTFERAIECGENFGRCDVDELLKLADELESYDEVYFEESLQDGDVELRDRQELVDVLRMEAELKQRQDHLKGSNLFVHDVEEAHDMKERDEYVEEILPNIE